jgi:hypothetical protein
VALQDALVGRIAALPRQSHQRRHRHPVRVRPRALEPAQPAAGGGGGGGGALEDGDEAGGVGRGAEAVGFEQRGGLAERGWLAEWRQERLMVDGRCQVIGIPYLLCR